MTSSTAGYLQVGGHSTKPESGVCAASDTIHVPAGMVTVVSLPAFHLVTNDNSNILLSEKRPDGSTIPLWTRTYKLTPDAAILTAKIIHVQWTGYNAECHHTVCFKVNFSFHTEDRSPHILPSGKWNCSVDEYSAFQHHLDCNLRTECDDGRDESGHCPFSSPACAGLVASRHKCFMLVHNIEESGNSPHARAGVYCRSVNASVAVLKNEEDFKTVRSVIATLSGFHPHNVPVGMFYGDASEPSLYRNIIIGMDKSVLHHVNRDFMKRTGRRRYLCIHEIFGFTSQCMSKVQMSTVCEIERRENHSHLIEPKAVRLPPADFDVHTSKQELVRCPSGWFTHKFLACQPHAVCGAPPPPSCTLSVNDVNEAGGQTTVHSRPSLVGFFVCGEDIGEGLGNDVEHREDEYHKVSYSMVCDFKIDCPDSSDEQICSYRTCVDFACANGQCLHYSQLCDRRMDCLDDSDESMCSYETDKTEKTDLSIFLPSPILVKFDGYSFLHTVQMKPEDSCPHTHYRCLGEYNDCMPVYTRCNGYGDCMDHEDEEGCAEKTCAGFYRCFKSTVCVHADHLCDGWPQCPQRDDEWLCDMTCPAGCLCVGLSFLCLQPFPAHLFPQLRYVDARDTGMSPSMLTNQFYLLYLNLARCSMTTVKPMELPNLQHLDLSGNLLSNVTMDVFVALKNLKNLILASNPIGIIHINNSSIHQKALHTIDLSLTNLVVFDSKACSQFHSVKKLNLSFAAIHTIQPSGFRHLTELVQLYMDGNPLKIFPANMLTPVSHLEVITAQTYKVCCRQILQDLFEKTKCYAPVDEISSCNDLLQSGAYRICLWLIHVLSVFGNMFCFITRVCTQKISTSGFHVFVTNLSMSDFLMGVYIAVIGVADAQFRGRYLYVDHVWTSSVACKAAGIVSLLSSEVSAIIIWLITLDRFIVLRFPFSRIRFGRNSAVLSCSLAWSVGFLLALFPLLPAISSWEFYSQTGICIPLPVTRKDFKGKMYSFSVLIVLNFVLFLLIAIGQAFIYWSVQRNALSTESTKVSQDMTIARRLISVAVTDFLCWFPIGLCGLMALAGIPIPGEVNVTLAIFVLPLNSALNPFIYTFNMLVEKRRKYNEERLIKWLESKLQLLSE